MLQNAVSKSIYKRLPVYLEYCYDLNTNSPEVLYVSSKKIADDLDLGEVQVRKDLSYACGHGKPKIGYNIKVLIASLEKYLYCMRKDKAILVGVGKLGRALLNFTELNKYGLEIVAGFDKAVISEKIPIYCFDKNKVFEVVTKNNVKIAILCVPKEAAQSICDVLVESGIKAIWNFVPVRLRVPKEVVVQNENLAYSVCVISSILK